MSSAGADLAHAGLAVAGLAQAGLPQDGRALAAIDLGAESCRVSLLRWVDGLPRITLVYRFPNAARHADGGLRWDMAAIETGLMHGLRLCAEQAPEGVRSIAVDGWAVDYVRLDAQGAALEDPFCYRDERTVAAELELTMRCGRERLRALTGVEHTRINTLHQLHADAAHPRSANRWLNLPEYVLLRLGGRAVAERTNATHTQLVALGKAQWAEEIFNDAGLDAALRPELVEPGTIVGRLEGELTRLPAFAETQLIAPACHDTASAVAGIPATGEDWAYLSSGTWSLVGATLDSPQNHDAACADNFTNLAGAGGKTLFHKSVNGLWLLRQSLEFWAEQGQPWEIGALLEAADGLACPEGLIEVDDPELLAPGRMPGRINAQRVRRGLKPLSEQSAEAPVLTGLILHSLAARYAAVLKRLESHTGRQLRRVYVVGGGSQNTVLNRLTAEASGLEVIRASTESATLGNFAVQLATLESGQSPTAESIARWAARLN